MMNRAFKRLAGRLLIALLLPALLCPAALADDQTADTWYFGGTGQETFYEATPLPNTGACCSTAPPSWDAKARSSYPSPQEKGAPGFCV